MFPGQFLTPHPHVYPAPSVRPLHRDFQPRPSSRSETKEGKGACRFSQPHFCISRTDVHRVPRLIPSREHPLARIPPLPGPPNQPVPVSLDCFLAHRFYDACLSRRSKTRLFRFQFYLPLRFSSRFTSRLLVRVSWPAFSSFSRGEDSIVPIDPLVPFLLSLSFVRFGFTGSNFCSPRWNSSSTVLRFSTSIFEQLLGLETS